DRRLELDETIQLSLANMSHGGIVGKQQPEATLTIVGDDHDVGDFGDAPLPYRTTLADSGAVHDARGPMLGATRDTETDGVPSPAADADGADEDGVTFGPITVGALGATVTVRVQGGAARLNAWIDFDRDGTWGRAGEHIFDDLPLDPGEHTLRFDVPSWAISGATYARFRLSTEPNVGTHGPASDGEVEDYRITLLPPDSTLGDFGDPRIVSADAAGATSVSAADVDGDGDWDILSASAENDTIAWYENDGTGNFATHTIATDANEVQSLFAADIDGDGDTDVLSASSGENTIAWYENDGAGRFTPHAIAMYARRVRAVFAADVDGDGDMDVLSAAFSSDPIAWYENDGNEVFTPHKIANTVGSAMSIFATDVDSDGDMDVLSISRSGGIAWYENDGTQRFTQRTIDTKLSSPRSIGVADLDGDGDMDVLDATSHYNKITWYENDGNGGFSRHIIASVSRAQSVFAADLDGDGDMDIVSGATEGATWYENDGSGGFTPHAIIRDGSSVVSLFAADIDGDGDADVVSAAQETGTIAWYENIDNQAYDFTSSRFVVTEGDAIRTTRVVTLARSGNTDVASRVDVILTGGTATAGEDFAAGPVMIEFGEGETLREVPIELWGDTEVEFTETLRLSLGG
ncbi:MAG: FG-GAP-like repeat-containing protein, partial [Pirellulales bacterium]